MVLGATLGLRTRLEPSQKNYVRGNCRHQNALLRGRVLNRFPERLGNTAVETRWLRVRHDCNPSPDCVT